jgi:ribosomal protein S3AE
VSKKWKGKDWYNIFAPDELGRVLIAQTPATDPKTLIGRCVSVSVADILGDESKYYMKFRLTVKDVEGKSARTVFGGFQCTGEHVMRMIRRNADKLECICPITTKDNYQLMVKTVAIISPKTTAVIKRELGKFIKNTLDYYAQKHNVYDLVRRVVTTEVQMRIKNEGSSIHPIRFAEIEKIRVLKAA